jgi:hypothetical protein
MVEYCVVDTNTAVRRVYYGLAVLAQNNRHPSMGGVDCLLSSKREVRHYEQDHSVQFVAVIKWSGMDAMELAVANFYGDIGNTSNVVQIRPYLWRIDRLRGENNEGYGEGYGFVRSTRSGRLVREREQDWPALNVVRGLDSPVN